jgi:hypothetical protein
LRLRQGDGGFLNYSTPEPSKSIKRRATEMTGLARFLGTRLPDRAWRYSGWRALACPTGASDMWSAWFRPLSLKLIADRYPEQCPGPQVGRYRALPGLGWHVTTSIVTSRVLGPCQGA